jgi:hypothetical protein
MSEKTGKPELICHLSELQTIHRATFPDGGHEHAFVLEFQHAVKFLPSGVKVEEPVETICLSAPDEEAAGRWTRDIIHSYVDIRAQRIFVREGFTAVKKAHPLMTKPQLRAMLVEQYKQLAARERKPYASQVPRLASPFPRSRPASQQSASRTATPPHGSLPATPSLGAEGEPAAQTGLARTASQKNARHKNTNGRDEGEPPERSRGEPPAEHVAEQQLLEAPEDVQDEEHKHAEHGMAAAIGASKWRRQLHAPSVEVAHEAEDDEIEMRGRRASPLRLSKKFVKEEERLGDHWRHKRASEQVMTPLPYAPSPNFVALTPEP